MADPRVETLRRTHVPYVVVVGTTAGVVASCRYAAAVGASALVEECSVANVATVCATWRPIAIVVPAEIYDFDASEFDALGRDAGGEVVALPSLELPEDELRRWLVDRFRIAAQRRGGV